MAFLVSPYAPTMCVVWGQAATQLPTASPAGSSSWDVRRQKDTEGPLDSARLRLRKLYTTSAAEAPDVVQEASTANYDEESSGEEASLSDAPRTKVDRKIARWEAVRSSKPRVAVESSRELREMSERLHANMSSDDE